jgi:hypothetical protein
MQRCGPRKKPNETTLGNDLVVASRWIPIAAAAARCGLPSTHNICNDSVCITWRAGCVLRNPGYPQGTQLRARIYSNEATPAAGPTRDPPPTSPWLLWCCPVVVLFCCSVLAVFFCGRLVVLSSCCGVVLYRRIVLFYAGRAFVLVGRLVPALRGARVRLSWSCA